MNKQIGYLLLATTTAVIILFAARHRALSRLRAGNASLQQQLDSQAVATVPEPATAGPSTNSIAQLNPDELSELLRLRGQISPLRRELQDMSNRVVMLSQPKRVAPVQARQMTPERQAEMQTTHAFMQSEPFTSAMSLAGALKEYLKTHAGELPDDLAHVAALARPPLSEDVSRRFELMQAGIVPEEARSYTFVAREKEARQLPDGKWVRIYIQADGGTSIAGPAETPDWPGWERFHEAMGKQRARKEQRNTQP
jgi:hypothetical protein